VRPPDEGPLALIDELERVLGIGAFPVNWPSATVLIFAACSTARRARCICSSARSAANFRAPVSVGGVDDPAVRGQLDDTTSNKTVEELENARNRG